MITTESMRPRRRNAHYINNRDFYIALVEYGVAVRNAEEQGLPRPTVPKYIGECFLKIATHLAYKPNFVNYSYRDDMISDSVENCLNYILNFNTEKYSNPFAYFTQIAKFAFIRRITKEKKQTIIKNKILEREGFDEVMMIDEGCLTSDDSDYNTIKDNISYKYQNR